MLAYLCSDIVLFSNDRDMFPDTPDANVIDLWENFSFPEGKVGINKDGELVWEDEVLPDTPIDPIESLLDAILQ